MRRDTYLVSKPRYEVLDGLRGVAALIVVVFHCFETYIPVFGTQHVNHGYLAVDFFFVLSGFVIGYAYDDRWGGMTTWGFFKRRLMRLQPMVVVGTLFGACLFFFAESDVFPLVGRTGPHAFLLCLVLGLLMIPAWPGLDIRGWGETNSFNGANWSLTLEYVGNILYAFVLRRLATPVLAVLCVGSLFFTLDMTMGWDVFGLFPAPKFDVIGGWSLTPAQMYIGVGRLLYPFLCGLLLSRFLGARGGSPLVVRGGFWWASLLLVALFAVPQVGGCSGVADGLYQFLAIAVAFPFVVLLGAGSKTTDPRSSKVCSLLGHVSYPLYITHYPLMYAQMAWVAAHPDAPAWHHVALNVGIVVVALGVAWASLKLYDEPVRAWLRGKLFAAARK